MVADYLVALDEVLPALVQPEGEELVQLGAQRFRERVVGGVSDQQVPEAERVLAEEGRAVGADELLADERQQARSHFGLPGRKGLHRPAVERQAFHGAPLEHAALTRLELIEPGREQRLDRRRHCHLGAAAFAQHREHLLDEEWVALGPRPDPFAQFRVG